MAFLKPQKVAFLLNEFPTLTETFIMNQLLFLIKEGIDVHIFTLYQGDFKGLHSQYKDFGFENNLTYVTRIPNSPIQRIKAVIRFFGKEGFWENLPIFFKLINPINYGFSGLKLTHFLYYLRINKINQYDLVHAHFGIMGVFFSKFVASGIFKNLPFLVSFHGYDLIPTDQEKNINLYKNLFAFAKLLTVNSNYTFGLLSKLNPKNLSRVKLLPMGIDTNNFDSGKFPNSEKLTSNFRLVFLGRLVTWKGADLAIEIVEKLVRDFDITNLNLSVIGTGPIQGALKRMVLEKKLQANVQFLGSQNQTQIQSILSEADLFIYTGRSDPKTGRSENQGVVIMEAQSMGVPVVAFNVGGVGEGIIDQVTGILVPEEDLDVFANSVNTLLQDKERRETMSNSARLFIKEQFDSKVLGKRLLDIYGEVIG